jgi:hypothetical protein
MSLFLLMAVLFALADFKSLRKEQRYLLYISLIYSAYYALSFLAKYRYLMPVTALMCVFAASHAWDLIHKKPGYKARRAMVITSVLLLLVAASYMLILAKKDIIIGLLGFRAGHFLGGLDLLVVMHLAVLFSALMLILLIKDRKVAASLTILVLIVPAAYSLAVINYGITGDMFNEGSGFIDKSKDMQLFREEALRPIPSEEAILRLNMGEYYDLVQFMKENTAEDAVVLSIDAGSSYYLERDVIAIDSYRMAESYLEDATPASVLRVLKEQGISYVIFRKLGWDAAVFGRGELFNRSGIIRNLGDGSLFEEVYHNDEFIAYRVRAGAE